MPYIYALLTGPQFMMYNVHQLLHLRDSVEDCLGFGATLVFSLRTLMETSVIYFMVPRTLMDR